MTQLNLAVNVLGVVSLFHKLCQHIKCSEFYSVPSHETSNKIGVLPKWLIVVHTIEKIQHVILLEVLAKWREEILLHAVPSKSSVKIPSDLPGDTHSEMFQPLIVELLCWSILLSACRFYSLRARC